MATNPPHSFVEMAVTSGTQFIKFRLMAFVPFDRFCVGKTSPYWLFTRESYFSYHYF
jgi:hypothetical protein